MTVPTSTTAAESGAALRSIPAAGLRAGMELHAFLRARGAAPAALHLSGLAEPPLVTDRADAFELIVRRLGAPPEALAFDPAITELSMVYAFDPATVLDEGVVLLDGGPAATPAALAGYHFRPPFGWMNDPNGFGRFGGRVHLFYQHYPHAWRWHAMHWGHAVSDDFLRWRHLPVFLTPTDEVVVGAGGQGGVFSGSAIAVPGGEGLRAFFTDHVKDRRPEQERQLSVFSADGVVAGRREVMVDGRPEGLGLGIDNRDPSVFMGPDGRFKMLLGGRDGAGGVILLYETDDPDAAGGWRFVAVLHREPRYGTAVAECPCLVPLDGPAEDAATRWALIFGLLQSRDPATRRRNLTLAVVGRFDGRAFAAEFEQEVDFGTDNYGFQAFADPAGPIGIGWLANWTDVSKAADFPTAMTLPRRLVLGAGGLLFAPIETAASLRRAPIAADGLLAGAPVALPGGAEIVLRLEEAGAPVELGFDHPQAELGLRVSAEGLEIIHRPAGSREGPRYLAAGARPREIRVFVDIGSIEVFADGGRHAGTRRIAGDRPVGAVRLAAAPGAVASVELWQLGL